MLIDHIFLDAPATTEIYTLSLHDALPILSQPAISKHLKVLECAGLVSRGRDAQRRPRRLEPKRLREATKWLERYRRLWEGNYQRLDALLEQLKAKEPRPGDRQ